MTRPVHAPSTPHRDAGAASCDHCLAGHEGRLPVFASANRKARTWLLMEHPGPWPADADQVQLPPRAEQVMRAASERGVRVQLIRRVRARRATPPLQVYAGFPAGAHGGRPWLEGRELGSWDELGELDVEALAAGRRPRFGEPPDERVILVCTHGRHNACCARLGRPLATALHRHYGDAVWETTHLGGDRYAANLVLLPHGLYYGSLDPPTAVAAVDAYDRGAVALERYRGHAGMAEPLQAAEYFVRARTGLCGLDAVTVHPPTAPPADTGGVTELEAGAGGTTYRVRVERITLAPPCGDDCTSRPVSYRLLDLTELTMASVT